MPNKIEKFPAEITENSYYDFLIEKSGLYLIEIIASCKNWRQNWRYFFNDDDLAVKIDSIEFPKLNGKNGLLNGEAAWNGNNLKGAKKIGIFILQLEAGDHKINFIANKNPLIHSINIKKIEGNIIEYIPAEENKQAEDENNRQWITLVLNNLPLKNLYINAKAGGESRDRDDIKLIIDGKIQKNPSKSPKYKNWYWTGNLLAGQEKEFSKDLNLPKNLHYIELWADKTPALEKITIVLEETETEENDADLKENKVKIQLYDQFHGVSGKENYDRFDKEIIEAVDYWNNFFANQEFPPKELLDYNLVKAIIYKESRIGYLKVEKGKYLAFPDVMQVGDDANPALKTLQGILEEREMINGKQVKLEYSAKIEVPKDSIYWGVRWLFHKAQGINYSEKRYWKTWKQAVIDYNGSETKLDYQKKIWQIYKEGIDPDGNTLWKKVKEGFGLLLLLILFGIILFVGAGTTIIVIQKNKYADRAKNEREYTNIRNNSGYLSVDDKPAIEEFLRELEEYKKDKNYYGEVFRGSVKICDNINAAGKYSCSMEFSVFSHLDEIIKNTRSNKQFLEAMNFFDFLDSMVGDVDNDGENEIIFIVRDALNRDFIKISTIDKINREFKLAEKEIDAYDGRIELRDLTGDLVPEIVSYITFGRYGYPLFIYQYKNQELVEIFNDEYIEFPEYTFSDVDNDGRMEIRVLGDDHDAVRDYRAEIKRIYEYNPEQNNFILIEEEKTEI